MPESQIQLASAENAQYLHGIEGAGESGGRDNAFRQARPYVSPIDAMTREIFSGEVTWIEKEDSEIPNEWYYTVNVVDSGEISEILLQSNQWHKRLCQFPAEVSVLFCLSIDAQYWTDRIRDSMISDAKNVLGLTVS